jgi:enhancing lycopene biosynthesis protein 2/Fe-S-cluster containining protein
LDILGSATDVPGLAKTLPCLATDVHGLATDVLGSAKTLPGLATNLACSVKTLPCRAKTLPSYALDVHSYILSLQENVMHKKTLAVILAGCGHRDGAEIHEATLTLWAIHKHGAEYQCFAPNIRQYHVLNHLTGEEMPEQRNVLIEAARIARGKIKDLAQFAADDFDGLVIPGGLGAAKNLCTYAVDGPACSVHPEVARAINAMHNAGKPIGALCIAPVILAKVLGKGTVTVGQDADAAANIVKMGGIHTSVLHEEIVVDVSNKIVTTPCYMFDARVDQVGAGADKLINAMLDLMPLPAEEQTSCLADIFTCTRCGYCCQGETTVSLDQEDQEQMLAVLGLPKADVEKRYWRKTGNVVQMQIVDHHCVFYKPEQGCSVHKGRPWRCGQWPLHPSILTDENNFRTIRASCPGINQNLSWEEFCAVFRQLIENDKRLRC